MKRVLYCGLLAVGCAAAPAPDGPSAHTAPPAEPRVANYFVFVASEGNDEVALVRFDGSTATVQRRHRISANPTELLGPHGITVSPDGQFYYVTAAHGSPNGALHKYATADDALVGRVDLGRFPATAQVSRDGHYAWVVNFNLYGDHVPSSVSVVYADDMAEVRRIETCVMPHGSRLSADGRHHYSACMMNDALVEIGTEAMAVMRRLNLGGEHAEHMTVVCSPTWAQPSPDNRTVWVACNKSNDIAEIDVASWTLRRKLGAGDGIYNLAVTSDGRLLVGTNKRGKSVSIIDVATGTDTRVAVTRRLPSGLVISPDNRFAFVTLEGVGSEPGTVDVIDLNAAKVVASVDVGQQAGGIDFWKKE
jgi:DNA-binding beta-propeller fold protein YncE